MSYIDGEYREDSDFSDSDFDEMPQLKPRASVAGHDTSGDLTVEEIGGILQGDQELSYEEAMALNERLKRLELAMADERNEAKDRDRRKGSGGRRQAASQGPPRRRVSQTKPAASPVRRRTSHTSGVQPSSTRRVDGAHTKDQAIKLRRDNMLLLRNLESIQKKEGSHSKLVKQSKPRNHVAASSVNRKKKLTAIERENLKFLKRLEGVKSTVKPAGGKVRARPGPPRQRRPSAEPRSRSASKPDWTF